MEQRRIQHEQRARPEADDPRKERGKIGGHIQCLLLLAYLMRRINPPFL